MFGELLHVGEVTEVCGDGLEDLWASAEGVVVEWTDEEEGGVMEGGLLVVVMHCVVWVGVKHVDDGVEYFQCSEVCSFFSGRVGCFLYLTFDDVGENDLCVDISPRTSGLWWLLKGWLAILRKRSTCLYRMQHNYV